MEATNTQPLLIVILALTYVVTSILLLLVFPMLFNFWIIPGIEKKIGKKLDYRLLIYRQNYWFGRWFCSYVEVSQYIFLKCLGWKRKLSPRRALVIAKYPIQEASRVEVLLSFLVMLNIFLWVSSLVITGIYMHLHRAVS